MYKDKIINSILNNIKSKCLRFNEKTIKPLKNINKNKKIFNINIISFNNLIKILVL